MVLFFVAFMSEWCGPGDIVSWTSVGGFLFLVALLVAWCIWTSREQTGYWWFEPDPNHVELEDPEEDDGASCVSRYGFLRRLIPLSWVQNRTDPESLPESHAMQDTTKSPDVHDLPDSAPNGNSAASSPLNVNVVDALQLMYMDEHRVSSLRCYVITCM
ncbi:hypothetical protein BS17DRAFT_567216 [Gyrodon lividus]|nr:hypothetical protein BS17DRAFT_567216 [Gyrodon lividus]